MLTSAPPALMFPTPEHGEPSALVHGGGAGAASAAGAKAIAAADTAPANSTGVSRAIFAIMILVLPRRGRPWQQRLTDAAAAVSRLRIQLLASDIARKPRAIAWLVRSRGHPIGMDLHGPPGIHARPPLGPATAHGPPGTPAETSPLGWAIAPGPPGTSAPAPSGPAAGSHGVPSGLKHGGGGGGSAAAVGASAIVVAAAPANNMDVIAFFSVAFMQLGYHPQATPKPKEWLSKRLGKPGRQHLQ